MQQLLRFTNDFSRYPDLPLALEGMGLCHAQEPVIRDPGLPIYQWVQTISGCGRIAIDGRELLIPENHGVFIPANAVHEYADAAEGWVTNFLCFNGALSEQILRCCGFVHSGVYFLENPQFILDHEQKIYDLSVGRDPYKAYEISKVLYDIIIELSIHTSSRIIPASTAANQKAVRAIRFMEKHYAKPLQLSDISDYVGLTKEYFCSLFKAEIGISAFDYLQNTRIANAKTFLINFPDKPIHEIASLCGFSSASYFCAVFRKSEQMTPKEFRVMRR